MGIDEAISRIIIPSRQRAAWRKAIQSAEESALAIFCNNLRSLLRTPPLLSFITKTSPGFFDLSSPSQFSVLGIDPGFSNGHKLAVVAPFSSTILATAKMFDLNIKNKFSEKGDPVEELHAICRDHNVKVIAIGDGVGSKSALSIVESAIISGRLPEDIVYAVVSEAGASVYSVSAVAREEHPDIEISICLSTL